jgi:hypothetical protein
MPRRHLTTRIFTLAGVLATVLAISFPGVAAVAGDGDGGQVEPLPALGALGANYNENLDQVNYHELRTARASWVRGLYMLLEADKVPPAQSDTIRVIREAHERGFHTLLSLKFPKAGIPFARPGSEEMAAELARLDRVLPRVLGTVDVVTIGNEPFIESMPNQRDERLNQFYETVARTSSRPGPNSAAQCAPPTCSWAH